MATMKLVPSTYQLSNSSYLAVSNVSNMYDDTDSTNYGTVTHNRASTNNTYYFYLRGFNFDDIPEQAVITGWTVKIKASATGHTTSTSTSYQMTLCNGTTTIGSTYASGRLSTSVTTFTFAEGSLTWDQLKTYGSDFGIRIPLRRASSNTADVISIYGAEIEVIYTMPVTCTITSTLSGSGTIDPSGAYSTYEDSEYTLTITPTDKSAVVTAAKDGVDITSQLVAHGVENTMAAVPDDVTTNGIQSGAQYAEYAVGYSAESPTSQGSSSNMYSPNGSTGYAQYTFDFSDIPSDATIEDIEVRCYGHRESATIDATHVSQCVIYNGSTAISNEENFPSTSNSIITIKPDTIPTRSQLDNVTLRHVVGYYGGLIQGISFEVTYSTGTGLDHYTFTYTVTGDAIISVVIGSASAPPVITIGTPDKTRISDETGHDECICIFTADQALTYWEARAVKNGVIPQRGVGVLVETGSNLAAGAQGRISVVDEELTSGDGIYLIAVYGQNAGGVWSE